MVSFPWLSASVVIYSFSAYVVLFMGFNGVGTGLVIPLIVPAGRLVGLGLPIVGLLRSSEPCGGLLLWFKLVV